MDAQNYFEERVPIDHIEKFIKEQKELIPDLSIMHIVMAALVRLISQRPHLNRFVMWNKIFARNHVTFSIAVKRSLSDNGEETLIKTTVSSFGHFAGHCTKNPGGTRKQSTAGATKFIGSDFEDTGYASRFVNALCRFSAAMAR